MERNQNYLDIAILNIREDVLEKIEIEQRQKQRYDMGHVENEIKIKFYSFENKKKVREIVTQM